MTAPEDQRPTTVSEPNDAGVTLPRSYDYYERRAMRSELSKEGLIDVITEGLHSVAVTEGRFATLMVMIDEWVVEEHSHCVDSHFYRPA